MPTSIELDENRQVVHLKCDFCDKEIAKRAGGRWNQTTKTWDFAFDYNILQKVAGVFPSISTSIQALMADRKNEDIKFLELKKEAIENTPLDYEITEAKLQPYNYQKHGIRCGTVASGGMLIADEMGLGKSSQALFIALNRKREGANSCLIVCPSSVKYNWLNEVSKFTHEKALVIDGNQGDRIYKWFVDGYFYKIVNYDILVRDLFYDKKVIATYKTQEEIPVKYKGEKYIITKDPFGFEIKYAETRIPNYDKILNNGFDFIIVDEIHYIKTHSAFRTRVLKEFKVKYKAGLTGTPLDGKLEELHSIFEFLRPHLFPSKQVFLDKHAVYDYFGAIKGYVKIDEVREKINPYYIRRLKADVLKDLPDKIYKDIYVEFPSAVLEEYNELADRKHEVTLETEAVVAVIRCRQFCDFPNIIDISKPSAKFNALLELLEEVVDENKQKVIIFSQYKEVTDLLCKKLNRKYNIISLDGDTPNTKRFEVCEKFNNDTQLNLIIMTDAGSVGINLTAATYVVHYDDNYSPSVMLQRADRAHRIGQKNVVTVVRFICRDTVEERVREIIDGKLLINAKVLDDNKTEMAIDSLTPKEILKLL